MFHSQRPPRPDRPRSAAGAPPEPRQSDARPHTVTAFDDDLREVAALTVRLGGQAEDLMSRALGVLATGDPAAAEDAGARRDRLAALERQSSARAASVLALRQPMATDLRLVLAALRVSAALGRIGDLAVFVAQRGAELHRGHPDPLDAAMRHFGDKALAQLGQALSAHQTRDLAGAEAVWRRDRQLDAHFASLMGSLVARMGEAPEEVGPGAQRLFVAKNLERIGDQARRIAAATWWMLRGTEIDAADFPDLAPRPVGRAAIPRI